MNKLVEIDGRVCIDKRYLQSCKTARRCGDGSVGTFGTTKHIKDHSICIFHSQRFSDKYTKAKTCHFMGTNNNRAVL